MIIMWLIYLCYCASLLSIEVKFLLENGDELLGKKKRDLTAQARTSLGASAIREDIYVKQRECGWEDRLISRGEESFGEEDGKNMNWEDLGWA